MCHRPWPFLRLHHQRDTGFAVHICHRYRELWIKARRLVARGLEDLEIADVLGVTVEVWVDVRLACGVPPFRLGHGDHRDLENMGAAGWRTDPT